MPSVRFFEEDISYKLKQKSLVKTVDKRHDLHAEGYQLKELNYIFCSDNYLLQINRQYLDHDTFTDIITFDNSETEKVITGDIFISVDRIKENAAQLQITEKEELHRVIIHGALHLLGYKDKKTADKIKMTLKEDFYLNRRTFIA